MKNLQSYYRTFISTFICILFFTGSDSAYSQADRKYIRKGNREYEKEKFSESEISYRKAIDNSNRSPEAVFNIGDALYKQKKYEEASKHFTENAAMNDDADRKAAGLYNLGNSLLQANKLKESIEAYKGSLKLKPDNFEAKYNLAYAQDLLKKQEQQQQQQQQNQNKDKNDQKDQEKSQDKKDDDKNKQDKNDNQNQKQDQQQKQQEQSISKEDAERLLNALANDERNVQEKVKLAKAAREKQQTVKNW